MAFAKKRIISLHIIAHQIPPLHPFLSAARWTCLSCPSCHPPHCPLSSRRRLACQTSRGWSRKMCQPKRAGIVAVYYSQAHSYAVYKTNINFNMYTVYTRTNERLEMVLYFIFREARWQWRWRVPFALTNDIINEDTVMYMARRPKDSVRFDI